MNSAIAEAPVVTRELRANWAATTATTVEGELPNESATSEVVARADRPLVFAVLPYARLRSSALPPRVGEGAALRRSP